MNLNKILEAALATVTVLFILTLWMCKIFAPEALHELTEALIELITVCINPKLFGGGG